MAVEFHVPQADHAAGLVNAVAIAHFKASFINQGRSPVAAAAYRHRARMVERETGEVSRYDRKAGDLVHEEMAIPENAPAWMREVASRPTKWASEELWNRVVESERQANGQYARDIIIALPVELSRDENIALMREFVREHLTSKGLVADWVLHDAGDGNPHVHLMHTLRPLTESGFGKKWTAVLGENGEKLLVNGKPVYRQFTGGRDGFKDLRQAWGKTANEHLAKAGYNIRIDMRSYREQGIGLTPTTHLGPGASMAHGGLDSKAWLEREARRQKVADEIAERPEELLKVITSQKSVFDERDVARTLHRYVDDPERYAGLLARVMASPELVVLRPAGIDADGNDGRAVLSTRAMVQAEHEMKQAATALAESEAFAVAAAAVDRSIRAVETKNPDRPFKFDAEQVEAVRHVTAAQGLAAVVGFAGAGKSTLLEAANLAWRAEGRRVFGAALAGKAAEGLEASSGIASRTLASWEYRWKEGRDLLGRGDVFVLDEAGMVGSRQMARIAQAVEKAGAKLVVVGDAMQLQPIEAGGAFRVLTDRFGYAELVGVRRQRDAWAQEASRQFARGQVRQALEAYRDHGCVREVADREVARYRIVSDWAAARAVLRAEGKALRGDELMVLAHANAEVRALNEDLRGILKAEGVLGEERAFETERGERRFAAGDRLIFLENANFTEPLAADLGGQSVKNGMLGTVVSVAGRDGRDLLRVRLDGGREVAFTPETYRNVDHGYAATVHKSQGATVDRVFVLGTSGMDLHLAYVGMSRHRHDVTLYAPRTDFRGFDDLVAKLGRSGTKLTTLDFENEEGYREALAGFARERGFEHPLAALSEIRLDLATKAGARIGAPAGPVLLPGVAEHQEALPAAARRAVLAGAEWRGAEARLLEVAGKLYRDPTGAVAAIRAASLQPGVDPQALGELVRQSPAAFAPLRDMKTGLFAWQKWQGRDQAVADIATAARHLAGTYLRAYPAALAVESQRREAMAVPIPDLSERMAKLLAEGHAARAAGGTGVWQQVARAVMGMPEVSAEVAAFNAALTARFGSRAFDALRAVPPNLADQVLPADRERLAGIVPTFEAMRSVLSEQQYLERMDKRRPPQLAGDAENGSGGGGQPQPGAQDGLAQHRTRQAPTPKRSAQEILAEHYAQQAAAVPKRSAQEILAQHYAQQAAAAMAPKRSAQEILAEHYAQQAAAAPKQSAQETPEQRAERLATEGQARERQSGPKLSR